MENEGPTKERRMEKKDRKEEKKEEKNVTVPNGRILNDFRCVVAVDCMRFISRSNREHRAAKMWFYCVRKCGCVSGVWNFVGSVKSREIGKSIPLANFLPLIHRIDLSMNSQLLLLWPMLPGFYCEMSRARAIVIRIQFISIQFRH